MERPKHLFLKDRYEELKDSEEWKEKREQKNTTFCLKNADQKFFIHNPDLFSFFGLSETVEFLNDLKNGYLEGLEALKNEEEITLSDLRSKDTREETIERLKYILYKKNFKNDSKGLLSKVRYSTPVIWSSKNIHEQGYCNGLFYSITQLLDKATITLQDLEGKKANNKTGKLFFVPSWCSIFYYADTLKYLNDDPTKLDKMKTFIKKHNIETTVGHFKTSYYEVKKQIENNTFQTQKLKEIIPFVTENYQSCVPKIENDITFIEENRLD